MKSVWSLLLFLLISSSRTCLAITKEDDFSGATTTTATSSEERMHVIRRIYGPDNANVRREVFQLEQQHPRLQTGISNHYIEYEQHPFGDVDGSSDRHLQEGDNTQQEDEEEDRYKPIRITFYTEALDAMRAQDPSLAPKIDFVKNQVLPRTREFWTQALAVVPIKNNLMINSAELANRQYCGDSEFTEVPSEHISRGVPDTDLIMYVSGTPSTRFCGRNTLAVAIACNYDQFDRPIAGSINFCLDKVEVGSDGSYTEAVVDDNVDVAIHEAAHVLGMSSNSYRLYWDPETGTPRTPRPFSTSSVTCVNGETRNLVMPSENTMKFFVASNGQRYASIVTPKVRAVARNQFDCQSLAGAQLENQPTGSTSCTGDHWDERLFYPEAISGVISPTTNILSPLTLALFEDSGWYKANYTQATLLPWGHGAGCDFVEESCLIRTGGKPNIPAWSEGYFCNESGRRGCSPSLTHKAACTVLDFDTLLPKRLPESRFQYFSSPTIGGPRQADYCPLYGSPYAKAEELDCRDRSNSPEVNWYSEVYSPDSQCFETTNSGEGRCYESACIKETMELQINIGGVWTPCEYDFQVIGGQVGTAGAFPIKVVCPRLSTACPDLFCPFNCAGRGTCDFANVNENGVTQPKCRCFDESDTSEGCSDSLIPDGAYLENAGGLFNNVRESFFDPLVAVFYDHPNKWTTASWAWAAGLLCLLIILLLCVCSTFFPEKPASLQSKSIPPGRLSPTASSSNSRTAPPRRPRPKSSVPVRHQASF
jgi:hypothetical protein